MKLDSVYPKIVKTRSSSIEHIQQCWTEEGEEGCPGGRCPQATMGRKPEPGGLVVAGVAVATSCQIILPIFGSLFLIVGAVLTIASYRGPDEGEELDDYLDRVRLTWNLRVLGPCCLAVGVLMLCLGIALCLLSRRAQARAQLPFHCPIHGDFYPISPLNNNKIFDSRSSLAWCSGVEEDYDGRPVVPQCPHSNRSSVSNQSISHSPRPSVIPHSTSGSLMPGNFLVNGENIGSIRSLSVSYDVASFPHSRSPSPTDSEVDSKPEVKDVQRQTEVTRE